MFVVVEGVDGVGKSTVIDRLADFLPQDVDIAYTREPTDGPHGRLIRSGTVEDPDALVGLFTADRKHHVADVIAPALTECEITVCDRYFYSTAVYQHTPARPYSTIVAEQQERFPTPDLLILLDAPPEYTAARLGDSQEINDQSAADVVNARRKRYYAILAAHVAEGRYGVAIDASRPLEDVCKTVADAVWSAYCGYTARDRARTWLASAKMHEAPLKADPATYLQAAQAIGS